MSFLEDNFIAWLKLQSNVSGLGDDMVVFPNNKGFIAYAVDQIIEGAHFNIDEKSNLVGRKLLARNLSDVAAMGLIPIKILLAINLANKDKQWLKNFYKGVLTLAKEYNLELIGGDISAYGNLMSASITIIAIGEKFINRHTAMINDRIFVTGKLGNSLKSKKHLNFNPRINEGKFLVNYVNAMMDISDGLSKDLWRLCKASKVKAKLNLNSLPLNKNTSVEEALGDGEDYELLFTVSSNKVANLLANWNFITDLTEIGEITNEVNHTLVDKNGLPIAIKGFDHLSNF